MCFRVLAAALLLLSCSGEVPSGVLPPKRMEAVLYDVIRADEWVDFSITQDSANRKFSKRTALYDSVFRLNKVTKEQYRKSLAFYQGRPDLLKKVFDEMRIKSDTALKKLSRPAEK